MSSMRAAAAPDFHQADADADVENLVLPDESIFVDRAHHVVRYLPRLFQRAADQQQRELIAADAPHRVRIAHRVLDQRGHLAQHVVAGGMPAGVVHDLESIEIQIAQRVRAIAGLRRVHGLLQAPFEFTAIHQPGERIVAGLIGHLPRESAQFAGVVQHQHQPRRSPCASKRSGVTLISTERSARRWRAPAPRVCPWSRGRRSPAPCAPDRRASAGRFRRPRRPLRRKSCRRPGRSAHPAAIRPPD